MTKPMRKPICPICDKTHDKDSACIWDNLNCEGGSYVEYYNERQKNYLTLLEDISEIDRLRSEINTRKNEKYSLSLKLSNLESKIANLEKQIQSNCRTVNLIQQEKELKNLKSRLESLVQEQAQLRTALSDISDYDELKSCLTLCQIMLNIH